MNAKTLKALKGSIKKWEKIAEGKGDDQGKYNCPLCGLFNSAQSPFMCLGCPVAKKTGQCFCNGTPYAVWTLTVATTANPNGWPHRVPKTKLHRQIAMREVVFLKSLLPEKNER